MSLLLALLVAPASGLDTDAQLIRPLPADSASWGLPPTWNPHETWSVQLAAQFERDPLVGIQDGQEVGSLVGRRLTHHLGLAGRPHDRVRVHASLPVVAQWGSDLTAFAKDGVGAGDLAAHLGVHALGRATRGAAVQASLFLPTGRRDAWVSERRPHGELLIHGWYEGVLRVDGAGGLDLRGAATDDISYFARRSAVLATAGVSGHLFGGTSLSASAHGRFALSSRPGTQSLEALVGLRQEVGSVRIHAAVGRGVLDGIGSPDLRAALSCTVVGLTRQELRAEAVDLGVDLPEAEEPPPMYISGEEDPPREGARVEGGRVLVTDPIRFGVNTAKLLPESGPAMASIAGLLADTPAIGHLVIEGHASAEGSFEHNYDLSARRARAIWEALLVEGVHPDRISYRGLGEVAPSTAADVREQDRRVEFRVLFFREPLDGDAVHSEQSRLPWSGDEQATPVARWPFEVVQAARAEEEAARDAERAEWEAALFFEEPEPETPLTEVQVLAAQEEFRQALQTQLQDLLLGEMNEQGRRYPVGEHAWVLEVLVDHGGYVREARSLEASGHPQLDEMLLEVVRQAEGLVRKPHVQKAHIIEVPVHLTWGAP